MSSIFKIFCDFSAVLIRVSRVGQELTERVEQVKGLDRRSINSRAVPVITTPENKPNRTETLLQS